VLKLFLHNKVSDKGTAFTQSREAVPFFSQIRTILKIRSTRL